MIVIYFLYCSFSVSLIYKLTHPENTYINMEYDMSDDGYIQ